MKERVFNKLPAIHQTDVLDKFFKNVNYKLATKILDKLNSI